VVGCSTGSRGEVPGERKLVTRDDDDDDDNVIMMVMIIIITFEECSLSFSSKSLVFLSPL
jgi:hypothetical protein